MKTERDRYIKKLMEKYNVYDKKGLDRVVTYEEHNKMIELELRVVRGE